MSVLQAALRTSSRSLAPTDHFRVYRRCLKSREAVANSLAPASRSKNSRLSERVTAGHSCRLVSKSRLARSSAFGRPAGYLL
jgi:hypothetical protein